MEKMQLNYDYFKTPECKILKSKVQSNPRYKNFTQLYYTVGDVEQFWVATNLNTSKDKQDQTTVFKPRPRLSSSNLFQNIDTFQPFDGYKNVSKIQVEDTFNYIFQKFKKGIYIKIKDGQLYHFIPFSKAFYINEWSDHIKIDPKYKSMEDFFKVHHDLTNKLNGTKYNFNINKINLDPSFWYANNCIFRYENPINEGETNHAHIKSMFLELCAERQLPDIEFFINRRDFPILTRNGTEPYTHIYGDNIELKSHKYNKYIPILSMCVSDKFADVLIPTHEDWARVKSQEGVFFPLKCRNYKYNFNLNWDTKKSIAVFRGSNTGCGFNLNNNMRLKLAQMGVKYPQFLDVGITNWSLRIRKNKESPYLQIPNVENLKLVDRLNPEQQSNFKYIINIDGHVSAFRLSLELSMGSCILMVESPEKWKMWFSDMLQPYVHYVPIKADLSDLLTQIEWCRKNDNKCKQMAQNSLNFYNKFLTKKGILDNLEKTLFTLHGEMYGSIDLNIQTQLDPLLFLSDMEHDALINDNKVDENKMVEMFPKNMGRNYGVLKGLEMFIKLAIDPADQLTLVGVETKHIFKSKTTRVLLYQIGTEYVAVKKTINPMKKIEFIHEAFIGKFVINNLLKICPNFVFTLGYRDEPYIDYMYYDYNLNHSPKVKETTVLQEFIKGPTLQEFLKSCTIKAYLEILLSLCCAISIAQTNYGFVHHDLKPWNIVVVILPEPIILEYYLRVDTKTPQNTFNDVVYKIKTKYIPVIIDYGKSHVIYNNVHYGIIEPFTINKYIDLVTLLISTLNELTLYQRENMDEQDLLFLINFLSVKKITNIHDLKKFLIKTKKFGNLDIKDLNISIQEDQTIFENFFRYISPLNKKYKISFGKGELTLDVWSSNPRQIVDMAFGLELEDKVNSYLEIVRRIYKNPMPQATNKFTTLMIAQKMLDAVIRPRMEFVEFATYNNLSQEKVENVLNEFQRMETFLSMFYSTKLNKKTREPFNLISEEEYKNIMKFDLRPSRSLFLGSTDLKMKTIQDMKILPAQLPSILYYRSLILDVLRNKGPFKIHEEDKQFYMDNFKLIFDEEFVSKIVDIETIRFYLNI